MHKSSLNWLSAIINVQHFDDHTVHYNYMMYSAIVLIYKKSNVLTVLPKHFIHKFFLGSKNTIIIPNKI